MMYNAANSIDAKDILRARGFYVELEKVVNPLQDALEEFHRKYVKDLCGEDLYRDARVQMAKRGGNPIAIACNYRKAVRAIREKGLQDVSKTGWKKLGDWLELNELPKFSGKVEEP